MAAPRMFRTRGRHSVASPEPSSEANGIEECSERPAVRYRTQGESLRLNVVNARHACEKTRAGRFSGPSFAVSIRYACRTEECPRKSSLGASPSNPSRPACIG
jgi:hypothetical protein